MAGGGPSGSQAVAVLAQRLAQAVADALARAGRASAEVADSRGVRSTWGEFRPTLSRAAHSLVLPGVPGGAVVDPDQPLAARPELARAASAAVRAALTPAGRGGAVPPVERARLAEDVGVLVLAFEIRQAAASWRLRVCLPANTLVTVLGNMSEASPALPPGAAPSAISPRTEVLRQIARQDPEAIADLLRRWLAEGG